MADFEPGTEVVVKATPTLLGIGTVIPTPKYSHERLTWVTFPRGTGVECAFEPGELETLHGHISQHEQTYEPTADELMTGTFKMIRGHKVPLDFQFHLLSQCADQSTCPIHPAPGEPMTVEELVELERKYPEPRAHFPGSTSCGSDCCEAR